MRHDRLAVTLLTITTLQACGGGDSPTSPTMGNSPVMPIVVSISAQVVGNATQSLRSAFRDQGIVENRNLRVEGRVDVTGGSATIGAGLTYIFAATPNSLQTTVERELFPARAVTGSAPFAVDIPLDVPPGTNTRGTVRIMVTGTDERGHSVDVSTELAATQLDTTKPPGTCVPDNTTLCFFDRFLTTLTWADDEGLTGPAFVSEAAETTLLLTQPSFSTGSFQIDTIVFSLDLEVVMRDQCTDNGLYTLSAFPRASGPNTPELTLSVTDTQTNQTREFFNPFGQTLPIFPNDEPAFSTCP